MNDVNLFPTDFNHLLRRWKCDRWFWFQLFLADMNTFDKETDDALSRLQTMESKLNDTTLVSGRYFSLNFRRK